jgi:hypothetical protein
LFTTRNGPATQHAFLKVLRQRKVRTTPKTGGAGAMHFDIRSLKTGRQLMNELRNEYGITTFEFSTGRLSDSSTGLDLFGGEMDGYDWLGEVASRLSGDAV